MYSEIFGQAIIHPQSFVCSPESIIGEVMIEQEVFVAPGAIIRADECGPFRICKGTNIQDLAVLHGLANKYVEVDGENYSIHIGSHCSIAHRALIHGPCRIGKKTFVGFNSIVHCSNVGKHCHIGFGAIIKNVAIADNRMVDDGMVVNKQEVADALPSNHDANGHFNKDVVDINKMLYQKYQQALEIRRSLIRGV